MIVCTFYISVGTKLQIQIQKVLFYRGNDFCMPQEKCWVGMLTGHLAYCSGYNIRTLL
jgi:hypothetical protein